MQDTARAGTCHGMQRSKKRLAKGMTETASSLRVPAETPADLLFYWDPMCPFAWMTSRWVKQVQAQKNYTVDWRFISLRILNADKDYDKHFPPEYEAGHNGGKRLLRMAAAIRLDHGREIMDSLYTALGEAIFDIDPPASETERRHRVGTPEQVLPILDALGLDPAYADALYDESWDAELQAETDEALDKTGRDVGTPILAFQPPEGPAFFGPVISRLPSDEEAVALWDSVIHLATFPGFAEIKRSLRERPQLRVFGIDPDEAGKVEDWHGGSRRLNSEKG